MSRPRKKNTHLPPCVHPKHGAYYYVKRGEWSFLGRTLAVALKEYAERFESAQHGGLNALIDRTMEKLRPTLAKSTCAQYRIAAKRLKKIFREFSDPRDVKAKHIVVLRTELAATPNMANRVLSFTRQVFDQALEEGSIDANPALGVKRLKEAKRGRLLLDAERDRIYAMGDGRLRVILDLLELCGQRVVATLQIKHTDLTDEGIRFPKFKTETKRVVKWTPELRDAVRRAKALRGNVRSLTYLLPGRGDRPPDYRSVKRQFDNACEAVRVEDAQMRDYRAVSATAAEEQGKDATALLGHTSPTQTRRYLRGKSEPVVEGPSFGRLLDTAENDQ